MMQSAQVLIKNTDTMIKSSSLHDAKETLCSIPPVLDEGGQSTTCGSDSSMSTKTTTTTTMTTIDSSNASAKKWSKGNRTWEDTLEALVAYKQMHGHCNVPYYNEADRHLGEWVNRQRKCSGNLTQTQKDMLDSIGFDWQSTQERVCKCYFFVLHLNSICHCFFVCLTWPVRSNNMMGVGNDKFLRLQAYFEIHGNSSVPNHYDDGHGKDLCNWISKQRQIHVQGRLSQDRIDKLNSVQFVWRIKAHTPRVSLKEEQKWLEKFQRLVHYKATFGNCAVPFQYEHDKSLGRWYEKHHHLLLVCAYMLVNFWRTG